MGVLVRRATAADIDWLVGQLKEFSRFFGSKRALFGDEEFARNGLAVMIDQHLLLVAQQQGNLLGFIGGYVTPHILNPDIRVLSEAFWWVAEEHRRSRAGLMLLNAFVDWGRENVDWITMALERHSPVKDETLTRRGFALTERSFLLEV